MIATLGSKEGLANLAAAITSPGDTILVPNPSYPIHQFGFIIAGASVRSVPATPDDDMLRALDRAVRHSVPKPTALIVNFPSNPTAYLADIEFYREIVAFARQHEIWVMSDLAYAEIYFGDKPPPSILQVPGAKDIAVEFTSLSKTYSMPGWRMGFAAGNPRLITALTRMKSYLDYGAFTPIQVAAVAALNGPQDCVQQMRDLYRERRDVLIRGLRSAGWDVPCPEGSMFAWAPIPPRFSRIMGSVEFSKLLLARAKVAVAPGIGFGEHGDGHVRIALVENTHRLRQAVRNIRAFLQTDNGAPAEPVLSAVSRMTRPLSVAVAGLGTVGARRAEAAARQRGAGRGARRTADRRHRRLRPRPHARPRRAARRAALVRRSGGARRRSGGGCGGGGDRRLGGTGAGSGARRRSEQRKPVVTANKALIAVHGAELAALAEHDWRAAGLRGGGRGRHPGHQGAARGAGGATASPASPASSTAPATTS